VQILWLHIVVVVGIIINFLLNKYTMCDLFLFSLCVVIFSLLLDVFFYVSCAFSVIGPVAVVPAY
jgi:hypothetical protein